MSRTAIEHYLAHVAAQRKASTAAFRYRSLQQWFKWLYDEEELDTNPMARMKPPKVLTAPVRTSVVSTYGELPDAGVVDPLPNKAPVELVGYGVQERVRGGGQPVWTGLLNRFKATRDWCPGTSSTPTSPSVSPPTPARARAAHASVTPAVRSCPTKGRRCWS